MFPIRTLCCTALALLSVTVWADPPYPLNGLHTEMSFVAAFARSSELGGNCKNTKPNRRRGGVSAACGFTQCQVSAQNTAQGEQCEQQGNDVLALTIAGQPISMVEFEASAPEQPVSTISIFFKGDQTAVREALLATFGSPSSDTESVRETSWSDSRRLFWQTGKQRAALLDSPQMIFLAADRKPAEKK